MDADHQGRNLRRRTLATIKLDPYEMIAHENRTQLAKILRDIANEVLACEHLSSRVLEIYEADELFEKRRKWANP